MATVRNAAGQFTSTVQGTSFGSSGGSLGTLNLNLTANAAPLVAAMNTAAASVTTQSAVINRQVVGMATAMERTGSSFSRTSLNIGLSLYVIQKAVAAVSNATIGEFAKWESSFAGVRKTVDGTEADLSKLAGSLRNMAKELPTNVNEINRIAEAAGQMGIEKENIVDFTRTIIDLGNTTNLVGAQGAEQMAKLANIVQMPHDQFRRLGSTIAELDRKLVTTARETTDMALRIASAGDKVGMTLPQILGFAAALSSVGIHAEMGGSAISQLMIHMSMAVREGGKELQIFADVAQMSVDQFAKLFLTDVTQALLVFFKGLQRVSDQGDNVFKMMRDMGIDGIRMTDMLNKASGSGELFAKALDLGTDAWNRNSTLTTVAAKRYETFTSQLAITVNMLREMGITVGEQLEPALGTFNKMLQASLKDTDNFANSIRGFTSEVGPTLVSWVGRVLDVWDGWTLIMKGSEVAVLQFGTVYLKVMQQLELATKAVAASVVDSLIAKVNTASTLLSMVMPSLGASGKRLPLVRRNPTASPAGTESDAALQAWTLALDDAKNEYDSLVNRVTKNSLAQAFKDQFEMAQAVIHDNFTTEGFFEVSLPQMVGPPRITEAALIQNKTGRDTTAVMDALKGRISQDGGRGLVGMEMGLGGPAGLGRGLSGFEDPQIEQASRLAGMISATEKDMEKWKTLNEQYVNISKEASIALLSVIKEDELKLHQLLMARNHLILQSSQSIFGDLASMAEAFAGKQSGIYKAMFAASKAFAIADAIVKIHQGIAAAAALPWPLNLGAIASVVAATASIVSNIQAVRLEFGGERALGGDVASGRAFLVGERGPELFVPSNDGRIVPNDELRMGGASPIKVVVNNFTDAKATISQRQEGDTMVIEAVIRRVKDEIGSEIRDGRGGVNKALESSFNLKRGNR